MAATSSKAVSPAPHREPGVALVASAFGLVARVRQAKALHPRGVVVNGTIQRQGLSEAVGVPWIDEPGKDAATVRLSRAAGLPSPLPDVLGLAFRVDLDGRPADVLLSTTGTAPGLRHVLFPRWDHLRAVYTSVAPYQAPGGLLMVAALPAAPTGFDLAVASPGGAWRRFGRLTLAAPDGHLDADIDFDAVRHPVPRLTMPPVLADLRARAYASSRRGRRG